MIFKGITRSFSLINEDQYNTIVAFWDEMSSLYGLENLCGLGYKWHDNIIEYAIGLKNGDIQGLNFIIELPDDNWKVYYGKTENLKQIYDEIYQEGPLKFEIETFDNNGNCVIKYYR